MSTFRSELTVKMVKEWDIDELGAFLLDLTLGKQAPGVTKSFLIKAIMTFQEEEIKSMLDTWGAYESIDLDEGGEMKEQGKCDHSGSKKGIFICGSSYDGVTKAEHVYMCHDCGAIYLHRYIHRAAEGEELTFIIMPGEVKGGVRFHEATATMLRLVKNSIGKAELQAIDRQATAIRNYVLDRLEQLGEQDEED